jgi:hypothetical protein
MLFEPMSGVRDGVAGWYPSRAGRSRSGCPEVVLQVDLPGDVYRLVTHGSGSYSWSDRSRERAGITHPTRRSPHVTCRP